MFKLVKIIDVSDLSSWVSTYDLMLNFGLVLSHYYTWRFYWNLNLDHWIQSANHSIMFDISVGPPCVIMLWVLPKFVTVLIDCQYSLGNVMCSLLTYFIWLQFMYSVQHPDEWKWFCKLWQFCIVFLYIYCYSLLNCFSNPAQQIPDICILYWCQAKGSGLCYNWGQWLKS